MREKKTDDLRKVLGKTHLSEFEQYVKDNKESMLTEATSFSTYIKELIREKGMTQQQVFLQADLSERYGYKLLSNEKRTRQRDIILRICYAAKLTLEETQSALEKYELPVLYAKKKRDALLMLIFEERPGSIIDVNEILKSHGFDSLRSSGVHE